MRDVYVFLAVMAIVTGALAALDRAKVFGNGKQLAGLDVAHVGFGASAGIIAVLFPKVQSA
jgi:hypothetical protein